MFANTFLPFKNDIKKYMKENGLSLDTYDIYVNEEKIFKQYTKSIYDENGLVIPVTVLEAGPCVVTQIKTVENDGYSAVQVGFGDKKEKIINKDSAAALAVFAEELSEGKEVLQFTRDFVEHIRNLLIVKYTSNPEKLLNVFVEAKNKCYTSVNKQLLLNHIACEIIK